MATFYFKKPNPLAANWQTLGNWWLDRAATIPATSLPTSSDDVVMLTICSENTGSEPTVNTAILEDNLVINLTVTNGMTVINGGNTDTGIYSSITGNVVFEDDTQLDGTGTINGNASFTENSRNRGTVTGTIIYNGFTGTDGLGVTYSNGRVSKFYWNGAVDNNYHTLGNWWTNQDCTVPAASLPISTDDVVMLSGPNYCEIVEEDIVVNTIDIQTTMFVAGPRPIIWQYYQHPKSLTATTSITVRYGYTLYSVYSALPDPIYITTPIFYLCPGGLVEGAINGDVIVDSNFCGVGGAASLNADIYGDVMVEFASQVFVGAYFVHGNIEVKTYGELHGYIGCQNLIMRTDSTLCGVMNYGTTNTMTFEGNSKIQEKNNYGANYGPSYLYNATFNDSSSIQNPEYTATPSLLNMLSYGITTFNDDSNLTSRSFLNNVDGTTYYADNSLYFNDNSYGAGYCYFQSWSISAAAKQLTLGASIASDLPAEIRYEKGVNGSSILGVV